MIEERQFKNLGTSSSFVLENNGLLIQLSGITQPSLHFPSIPFTRAGKELQNLIEPNPCMPYLQSVANYLRQKGLAVKKGSQVNNGSMTVISFDEDF